MTEDWQKEKVERVKTIILEDIGEAKYVPGQMGKYPPGLLPMTQDQGTQRGYAAVSLL